MNVVPGTDINININSTNPNFTTKIIELDDFSITDSNSN